MDPYLGFDLYAPLAACGEVTVGERRTGYDRPARSAVIGLLAAALGLERPVEKPQSAAVDTEREKEERLLALDGGYGVAMTMLERGALLEDYHTAQVPPAKRGRTWATRRDELAEARLNTVLSKREYRQEAGWRVVLWAREGAPVSLERLRDALKKPHFTLYLGRKACPLGLPPDPWLDGGAESLPDAFARRDGAMARRGDEASWRLKRLLDDLKPDPAAPIYLDADGLDRLGGDWRRLRVERRRDLLLSRRRWQHAQRDELVCVPEARAA